MDVEKKARLAANIADYWRPVGGQVPRRRFEEVTTVEQLGVRIRLSPPAFGGHRFGNPYDRI